MSSGNQFERLFKLLATVGKLVLDGKRSPEKVADVLQSIVDNDEPVDNRPTYYLHDRQKGNGQVEGEDLLRHLEETGLIGRTYSLEDHVIKLWIADPLYYPDEFKAKRIFIWKSKRASGDTIQIACLIWDGSRAVVNWYGLSNYFGEVDLTLLHA